MTFPDSANPGRRVVDVSPDLLAVVMKRWTAAKQAYDIAEAELSELKADIKAACTTICDPATGFPYTKYEFGALDIKWQTSTRISTPLLRKLYPDIATECSSTTGSWVIKERPQAK
jgi:hypothetical protein